MYEYTHDVVRTYIILYFSDMLWHVFLTLGGPYCKHFIHLLINPHALNIDYKVNCIHL